MLAERTHDGPVFDSDETAHVDGSAKPTGFLQDVGMHAGQERVVIGDDGVEQGVAGASANIS